MLPRVMPAVGTDHDDVGDAARATMLKRIVENDDVTALLFRLRAARNAIGRDDDGNVRVQHAVHERLVLSVATQHDCRLRILITQPSRKKCRERSLAGATNCQIADTQRGHGRRSRREHT